MKAKKVYESITDVLKPKTDEEIHAAFRQRHQMSWEKYLKYAEELESRGVEILELYSLRIHEMTVKIWTVFSGNWQMGRALTKKDAMSMIQVHKQYSYEDYDYHMSEDHAYLTPHQVRNLVYKFRMGIKQMQDVHSPDYTSGFKWDNPEYKQWQSSPEGKAASAREWERYKIEKERGPKIDEGSEDVLKPKTTEEITKNWPKDWNVTPEEFLNTWKQLEDLGVNLIGTQTVTIGGKHLEYVVYGFYVFRGNNGVARVLTEKDAKELSDDMERLDYTKQEYSYRPEKIFLDYSEARNYIAKRLWKIKKYPEKGQTRQI
ncbi:MAG: hypothetical protein GYA51_05690 [Candidatus Methanofastidiosa archaeon]|nr:hypothetical protein [Candidatus Methanofastidiosa archaeon]